MIILGSLIKLNNNNNNNNNNRKCNGLDIWNFQLKENIFKLMD
jgi:hypothetical protein